MEHVSKNVIANVLMKIQINMMKIVNVVIDTIMVFVILSVVFQLDVEIINFVMKKFLNGF
jgi:hypothetical protein